MRMVTMITKGTKARTVEGEWKDKTRFICWYDLITYNVPASRVIKAHSLCNIPFNVLRVSILFRY